MFFFINRNTWHQNISPGFKGIPKVSKKERTQNKILFIESVKIPSRKASVIYIRVNRDEVHNRTCSELE